MQGVYELTVLDTVAANSGTLLEWCLIFRSSMDVDGDGEVLPLTDALLILRHSFGFTGSVLVNGAVNLEKCARCTATEIESYRTICRENSRTPSQSVGCIR